MTRDDTIRLARCSGSGIKVSHEKDVAVVTVSDLEDFARRARAAERERIETSRPPGCRTAIERARQEEREACAKLCDERSAGWDQVKVVRDDVEACMNAAAKNEARALGAAIRSRTQP